MSCSKIVLVDVLSKKIPSATQRVYAIIDEQSNSSLISSELADQLGVPLRNTTSPRVVATKK